MYEDAKDDFASADYADNDTVDRRLERISTQSDLVLQMTRAGAERLQAVHETVDAILLERDILQTMCDERAAEVSCLLVNCCTCLCSNSSVLEFESACHAGADLRSVGAVPHARG